ARPPVAAVGLAAVMVVLGFRLGGLDGQLASARVTRADVRTALTFQPDADFLALVERVRAEPRAVIAEPMDVEVLAGRQVVLEPFIYNLLIDAGRWHSDPLVDRICNGEVGLVVLAYSLEVASRMTDGLHALWPPAVIVALHDTTLFEGMQAQRYVY